MPLRAPALGPAPRQGEPPCRQVRHPSPCLVTGGGKRQGWRERRAGARRAQNGARVSRAPAATLSAGFQREGGVQGPILYFFAPGHDALAHPAAQQAAAKRYRLVQSNFSRARCSVGGGDARTACSAWHAPPPPFGRETYLAARRAPVAAPAWRAAAARRPRPPAARGRCPRFRRTATASRGAPSRVPLPAATPTTPQGGSAGETPATRARALDVHHHHAGLLQSARAET